MCAMCQGSHEEESAIEVICKDSIEAAEQEIEALYVDVGGEG